ncbi:MAG: TetR/AcrR family transcriptional regulator [Saprospiraceae bacterium]
MTKKERTRQYIIEQAAPLFNQKGYAGTSLHDIMETTGLKKGGIYGNFDSKEEIAVASFEYAVGLVTEKVKLRADQKLKSYEKLQVVIDFYRNYLANPPIDGGCPILNTSIEADDTNPRLRNRVIEALDNWRGSMAGTIRKGIRRKEIKSTIDAEEFATLFIATLEGGIMMSKVYKKIRPLNIVLNHLERMIQNELILK